MRFRPAANLLLVAYALSAPAWGETVRWSEEVELSDSRTLRVERYGEWGSRIIDLPGAGGIIRDELSFAHDGQEVRWTRRDSPTYAAAAILDFVAGAPVVVIPVRGAQDCSATGYPLQGFAAYRWEQAKWQRMDAAAVPPQLRANLVSAWIVKSHPEYHGKLIPVKDKARLNTRDTRTRHGTTIADLARPASADDEACGRWDLPSDVARDSLSAEILKTLEAAPIVPAQLYKVETAPMTITREDYRRVHGRWTGWSWLRDCEGIVRHVGPLRQALVRGSSHSWKRVGSYLLLSQNGTSEHEIAYITPTASLSNVMCAEQSIYLIERLSATLMTVAKLATNGKPLGAVRIGIPQAETPTGKPWPRVWDPHVIGRELRFTIGTYKYERSENKGGAFLDAQQLVVPLPF